jgi:NAD(P)-dependent dehydrogenase (short-subunit alcohol dehydrogenase family)
MARVFITGSSDGLGLLNARTLLDQGHDVLLHARSEERAKDLAQIAPRSLGIAIGDLSSDSDTRSVARQANDIGRIDAVIHNAGVYLSDDKIITVDGHSRTLAVNVLAPYLLTACIEQPERLVYISSGMHLSAHGNLDDIDWVSRRWNASQAYSESKLLVSALSAAVAGCPRRWAAPLPPTTCSSATRLNRGSPSATTPKPVHQASTGITNAPRSQPMRSQT